MTLTHKIYDDLSYALKNGKHHTLSKLYTTRSGISLIYAMDRDTEQRYLFFEVDENTADNMQQCKGLSIGKVHLYEYSPVDYFCQISQNLDGEDYIYEIIIEDIRKTAEELTDGKKMAERVSKLLLKWKSFFAQNNTVLLSPERQQGLYGELLFLKQLIESHGAVAVSYWSGCDFETHDFYVKGNAFEIKTTSMKAPYKMHISSEYQLDDAEIQGELLIDFFALRKSSSDGENLPELISCVRSKLQDNPLMNKKFNTNLESYGYFDGLEDKYTTRYHIREEHTYCVYRGFPRIIKQFLNEGISGCTYDVLISNCTPYEINEEEKIQKMRGSETVG